VGPVIPTIPSTPLLPNKYFIISAMNEEAAVLIPNTQKYDKGIK
jgi:hypothetical protein